MRTATDRHPPGIPAAWPSRPGRSALKVGCLLTLSAFGLSACRGEPSAPVPSTAVEKFDVFWSAYERTYPYFEFKKVDWQLQRTRYRDAATAAPSTDFLVEILRATVAPLNDVHIAFVHQDGRRVTAYAPYGQPNWVASRWLAAARSGGWVQVRPNLGYARFGDIAYIAVGSWNRSDFGEADLDRVLDQVRSARALILDVRSNGGGDDALAFTLAGRFSASAIAAGSVRYRSGAGLGAPIVRSAPSRGPWTWTAPVVLLVGRLCFSSNESFIGAMATLPHVTTMGDTTGGGSGNPETRTLGDGWSYRLPRWIEYAPDGRVIEWNGIAPDVHVPFDTAGLAPDVDPVIRAARQRLGGS